MLRFLHLSDMHIGQARATAHKSLYETCHSNLIEDCKLFLEKKGSSSVDGIVITGDIAYSGVTEDYDEALAQIRQLQTALDCEAVFLVPGNHDVDWMKINILEFRNQQKIRKCDVEKLAESFYDYLYRTNKQYDPLEKLQNFNVFCRKNKFWGAVESPENAQWHEDLVIQDDWKIRMHGMCSVLLSNYDDVEGQMILGVQQIHCKSLENKTLEHMVLMHHPIGWFMDRNQVENRLMSKANLILSGHVHNAGMTTVDDVVLIGAGAYNPARSETSPYSYNWLELSIVDGPKPLKIEYTPRIWNPGSRTEPFTADIRNRRFNSETQSVVDFIPSTRVRDWNSRLVNRPMQIAAELGLSTEDKLLLLRPELFQSLRKLVSMEDVPAKGTSEQLVKALLKAGMDRAILERVHPCLKVLTKVSKGEAIAELEARWALQEVPSVILALDDLSKSF